MKIAIAGYGLEGKVNYEYWAQHYPDADITIVDDQNYAAEALPEEASAILGEGAFQQLSDFDLVIRTPGISPYKIKTDGKIWSATNEFFEKCPAQIIGITGSKGKGTTASLIDSILKASGKTTWLVGNIGLPSLKVLEKIKPDDIVVYELSSFQLWDLERSPNIAVVTIIEPDHLDVHVDFDDYISAKSNITRHQKAGDKAYYYPDNKFSRQIAEAGSETLAAPYIDITGVHTVDNDFYNNEQKICSVDALQIPGRHNIDNACAAISVALNFEEVTAETIEQGIRNFHGLPHRLSFVKEVNGVKYYDDSIATTPGSAVAALKAFARPKVLILGGSFKGSDFSELADEIVKHDVQALIIGEEAARIIEAFGNVGFTQYEFIERPTMMTIVERAHELAQPGSVVLLSPAAASFGLFKNYADRGEQFIAAVNDLVTS